MFGRMGTICGASEHAAGGEGKRSKVSVGRSGRDGTRGDERGLPEEEIGVGHEVGDALEHAPWLKNECRERHLVQVHPHAIHGVVSGARRGPHDRGAET